MGPKCGTVNRQCQLGNGAELCQQSATGNQCQTYGTATRHVGISCSQSRKFESYFVDVHQGQKYDLFYYAKWTTLPASLLAHNKAQRLVAVNAAIFCATLRSCNIRVFLGVVLLVLQCKISLRYSLMANRLISQPVANKMSSCWCSNANPLAEGLFNSELASIIYLHLGYIGPTTPLDLLCYSFKALADGHSLLGEMQLRQGCKIFCGCQ